MGEGVWGRGCRENWLECIPAEVRREGWGAVLLVIIVDVVVEVVGGSQFAGTARTQRNVLRVEH